MASEQLGVGMVGYGFMGKTHTYAYKSIPVFYDPPPANVRLVGVCTSRAETAQRAAEHGGYEFGTTDYHELLERDDIHIINCCTPNYLHKDLLVDALNAGKHVYCDKPLAMNLAEAREIVDAAEKANSAEIPLNPPLGKGDLIVHQMTFEYRFIPAIMRAKQLIDEGFLGDPLSFRAAYLHSGYTDPNRPMSWRLDKKQGGGGALFDLGSHVLDLVRYLLGECKEVFAAMETFIRRRPVSKGSSEFVNVEVDDLALLLMRMENGALGTVEASRIATGTNDDLPIEIYGTQGSIKFDLMEPEWLYVYDNRTEGAPIGGRKGYTKIETVHRYPEPAVFPGTKCTLGWVRFHIACMYNFLSNVVKGKASLPTLYDGLKVQEIMEAALESAERGSWIEI